jgi:predicted ATPase
MKNTPTELLYLDNFRGFAKTVIPIRPITFLVGENSTGKSSVMSVLHLVRNYSFWSDPDFDTHNQHLGGFDDLRTSGARRTSFVIGSARDQINYEGKLRPSIIIGSFENNEGLPQCTKLSVAVGGGMLTVLQDSGHAFAQRLSLKTPANTVSATDLQSIVELHEKASPSNTVKLEIHAPPGVPLFHLIQMGDQMLRQGRKDEKSEFPEFQYFGFWGPESEAVWLAPIRTKPRRTYDGTKKAFSAEGDHTPYLLKSQLSRKTIAAKFRSLLERLGRDSHLFDNIGIRSFGRGNGAPFEVQVEVDGVPLSLSNVGYGVSQVLPILVEVLARSKNSIFHIQQPEVHLHPRAQAALGELIYLLAVEEEKRFVIETHSDFLIDRFRSMIKEKGGDGYAGNSSVIFFHREKGHNVAQELLLSEEGEYPIDQPSTFRDFFINEEMRSLSL